MGRLGDILEASWAVLGGRKPKQATTSKSVKNQRKINFRCLLGLSWRASWRSLGPSRGPLGPSWGRLGPSWGPLGPSWGGLRGLLGRLGASGSRKGEKAKNIEKHNGKSLILASRGPLRRPLGGLLGRLGGLLACHGAILEASWPVLGPSWASWSTLWASREPLGPSWAPLGALWARLGAFLGDFWSRGVRRDSRPVPHSRAFFKAT